MTLHRPSLLPLYRCISCGGTLAPEPLACTACGRAYATYEGRPVLMDIAPVPAKHNAVVHSQAVERTGSTRSGLAGLADRFRAATTVRIFADDNTQIPLLVDRVKTYLPRPGLVVDVGACEQYYRAQLERLGEVVAMDVSIYGPTDLLADCHALPFRDGVVDAICAVEVIEHLSRPWVFFAEAARVLKPGGVLFGVAPQYIGTHGFPYDFFRYTESGLRALGEQAGLSLAEVWSIGGEWGTLLHWYWSNRSRENPLRRIPGVSLAYHAWFQLVAATLDRVDGWTGRGAGPSVKEHNDHVGWSFVFKKPEASAAPAAG
ncbi:MAG: methyltransferase domain-containing protein [Byssovorax sp.]